MRRNKKTKIIMIVAFVLAIVTMSAGFAAFSSVLTISSRATVTPDVDFKMKIYGTLDPTVESLIDMDLSDTKSVFLPYTVGITGEDIIIDNETFTISNISVTATNLGDLGGWLIGVTNEGNLPGYVNVEKFIDRHFGNDNGKLGKVCIASEGTSQDLVDLNCNNIFMQIMISKPSFDGKKFEDISSSELVNGYYKLEYGDWLLFSILFSYGDANVTLADGPFTVEFDDVSFEFLSSIPDNN